MLKYYLKIIEIIESFLNLIIVVALFPFHYRPQKIKKSTFEESVHVLGNGPSLKNDFSTIVEELTPYDSILVVNSFASTNLFETIKPSYYVIIDPSFFLKKNITSNLIELQKKVMDAILKKTTWNLTLIVPRTAKRNLFFQRLKENKNIKIVYFKSTSIFGGNERMNNFFFKSGLANPLFQNVLIPSLFFSIKMGFKNIYVWGADHSWHTDYVMGKDNILYTPDKHFYSKSNEIKFNPHLRPDGSPVKIHEEFFNLARAFRIYHSLQSFSKSVGCNIINRSSISWIDAFPRKNERN